MKLRLINTIFFLLVLGCLFAQNHKIVVAGSGNKCISIFDKTSGKVEWFHQLENGEECNSVAVTKQGNILYSYKKGAKLITTSREVVWDYQTPENTELQSATYLPDGGFLLGICGNPAQIIELDKTGKERHKVIVDLEVERPHSQFRQVIQLRNGNYLLPVMAKQTLMELNKKGEIVAQHKVDGKPFSALECENGDLILPCGDARYYLVLNKESGEEIRKIGSKDIDNVNLLFVAQILELPNQNLLICNWHGHNKDAFIDEPQLIEIDKKGQLVWSINDKENLGKISAACYVDDPGILKLK